jgi:uncharacterized membrane protein
VIKKLSEKSCLVPNGKIINTAGTIIVASAATSGAISSEKQLLDFIRVKLS